MKLYWENTWQYKRILEALEIYWLSEPNEKAVEVTLKFEHENGEFQGKTIRWVNPKYEKEPSLKVGGMDIFLRSNRGDCV